MWKWMNALTLALCAASPSGASILTLMGSNELSGSSFPASAPVISGVDGPLAPAADSILPYRDDGIFSFSAIELGDGVTLHFDLHMQSVKLLSLGNILIAGRIDAPGINLTLETPGQIFVTGTILADSISLRANTLLLAGELAISPLTADGEACRPVCGPLIPRETLLNAGRDIPVHERGALISAVPEPATLWLAGTLLPFLALSGRKRKTPGMA